MFIGIDFGTNSCRSLLVDLNDGREAGSAVFSYPSGELGSLPIGELNSVFGNFFLASETMPAVLLVGFFEIVESRLYGSLAHML